VKMFKHLNSLLSLGVVACLSMPVWADDPDFSASNLFLPKVTVDKLTTFNNVELGLEFTTADRGNFILKRAEPEYIVQTRTLMMGGQEVPPQACHGTGVALLSLNLKTGALRGTAYMEGLTQVAMSHIHIGDVGVSGTIIVTLVGDDKVRFVPEGTILTTEQIKLFLKGGLYINVHTDMAPTGEIRGQIVPQPPFNAVAALTGAQEVPAVQSDASGVGILTVNPITREVSGKLTITGLKSVTAAHIHQAAAGRNGDVIINLVGDNLVRAVPAGTVLTVAQFAGLLRGELYFNVHTAEKPAGEIRGQIQRGLE